MSDILTVHVAADPVDATPDCPGYDVYVGSGILDRLPEFLPTRGGAPDGFAVVCDENTGPLFGDAVAETLRPIAPVTVIQFDGGEENKSLHTLSHILERMAAARLTRRSMVIALGGGIVGDVAGFAAASYMRGIRCVQLPTTLLAAVDSSVGGKTAVNLGAGKNLAGAFWQPSAVVMDADTLRTLPPCQLANGLAEALKHGILCSPELFRRVASGEGCRPEVIAENIRIKAEVVAKDARENGLRKTLNLGHTFGHAIEKCSNFEIQHGHGVAIGTCMAARAAASMGMLSPAHLDRILAGFAACGLPTSTDLPPEQLADGMLSDKKRTGGYVDFILPTSVGSVEVVRTPVEKIPDILSIAIG